MQITHNLTEVPRYQKGESEAIKRRRDNDNKEALLMCLLIYRLYRGYRF